MTFANLRDAWSLLQPQTRRRALWLLGLMILSAFASAGMVASVFPFLSVLSNPGLIHEVALLDWAYTRFGFTSDYAFLVSLGVGSITIIVATNLLLLFKTYVLSRFTLFRIHELSRALLGHYLAQPYETFLDAHSGDLATNVLSECNEVVHQVFRPAAEMVSSLMTVIAIAATLIALETQVALITFSVLGLSYAISFRLSRRAVRRLGEIRAEKQGLRYRLTSEAMGGIKDVLLIGRAGTYLDRFSEATQALARAQSAVPAIQAVPKFLVQILVFSGIILIGLLLLDPSALGTGTALAEILPLLGLLAFAGQRALPELNAIYFNVTAMNFGLAALRRISGALKSAQGWSAPPREVPAPLGLRSELALEDVTYRYPGADRAGLTNVSLTIRTGERIGIVGTTGAGKTTLADVILGLLVPQSGHLVVDGVALDAEMLPRWRQTVGYVPQDIFLTDASITENVAFGVPAEEIDGARVEDASRIAQLHTFVTENLPEGYATLIGERGVRLSGGQRQRIGIARALYHHADLILFDEATSALDNATERDVISAVKALPGDKTLLMIAHRLSTVRICDRIVVLNQGRVAGLGTWDELEATNLEFRRIARVE